MKRPHGGCGAEVCTEANRQRRRAEPHCGPGTLLWIPHAHDDPSTIRRRLDGHQDEYCCCRSRRAGAVAAISSKRSWSGTTTLEIASGEAPRGSGRSAPRARQHACPSRPCRRVRRGYPRSWRHRQTTRRASPRTSRDPERRPPLRGAGARPVHARDPHQSTRQNGPSCRCRALRRRIARRRDRPWRRGRSRGLAWLSKMDAVLGQQRGGPIIVSIGVGDLPSLGCFD